ncbi:MAG: hypothetical protein GY756_11205, partial [bacterium]|nr:hypothetical protein [bacterium]
SKKYWDNIRINTKPSISIDLPETIYEGSGALQERGKICLQIISSIPETLHLFSDNESLLFPDSITIPAGDLCVEFDITVQDTEAIEGHRDISFYVENDSGNISKKIIKLMDNDDIELSMDVPSYVKERIGLLKDRGTIFIDKKAASDLFILLKSGDNNILSIPEYVFIPKGENSVNFDIYVGNSYQNKEYQFIELFAEIENHSSPIIKAKIEIIDDASKKHFDLVIP